MSHNGDIGQYSRYSVLPLFGNMESVLALRYRFWNAGRSWEGGGFELTSLPMILIFYFQTSTSKCIFVPALSEMDDNLTKGGGQKEEAQRVAILFPSHTPVAASAPPAPTAVGVCAACSINWRAVVCDSDLLGRDSPVKFQQWSVNLTHFQDWADSCKLCLAAWFWYGF